MSNPAEVYHHQHHHHHVQSPVHGVGGFGQALPPQTHHGLNNNNNNNNNNSNQYGQQSNTSPGQGNSYFNSGPRGQGNNGPMNSNSSNNGPMNLNMGGPGHNGHHDHHGHHNHHNQGQGQGIGPGPGPGSNNRGYDNQQLGGQYPLDTQGGQGGYGSGISPGQDKPLPAPAVSATRHDHHHGHHRDGIVDPQSGITQDNSIRSPTSGGPGRHHDSSLTGTSGGPGRHHDSSLTGKTGSGGLTGGRPTSYGDSNNRNSDLSSHSSSKSGNHHSGRIYDNTNSSADKYSTGAGGTGTGMGNGLKNDSINTNTNGATDTNGNNLNGSSGYGNAGRRHSPTTHEKVTFGDKIAGFTQKMSGKINKRPEDITDGEARMAGSYDTTY